MHRLTLVLLAVCLLFPLPASLGVEDFEVANVTIRIYEDGRAYATYEVAVNETVPYVLIDLITSEPRFMLVTSDEDEFLAYDLTEDRLMVYTLGEDAVNVEFEIAGFATRIGDTWIANFTSSYNSTLILPEGSTLIYLSGIPIEILEEDGAIIRLSPGSWEIGYTFRPLPYIPLWEPGPEKPEELPEEVPIEEIPPVEELAGVPRIELAIAGIVAIGIALLGVWKARSRIMRLFRLIR